MKLMKRIAAGLAAAAISLTLPLSLKASAAREIEDCFRNITVFDKEGVLTAEQEKAAAAAIRHTSDVINMYVAVVIVGPETSFSSDYDVEDYAEKEYINLFDPDPNKDTDGVLLLMNDSTNYDYLATQGLGQLYYYNAAEEDRVEDILEAITPQLKVSDHFGAIETFCKQLEKYFQKGIPENAYTYNSDSGKYLYYSGGKLQTASELPKFFGVNWKSVLITAAIIGTIVGLISMLIVKSSYKLKKSLEPTNYVSNQETQFHVQDDLFLRTHTTKVHLGDSSRGGGGGGGGFSHSSGGHSFGGGGHHR